MISAQQWLPPIRQASAHIGVNQPVNGLESLRILQEPPIQAMVKSSAQLLTVKSSALPLTVKL
jgi:hypothetical protein